MFGAFQRLRRHLDALRQAGRVDVVFLWPEGRRLSPAETRAWEERARGALGLTGTVGFVPVALRTRWLDRLVNLLWACRGAIGFFRQYPTMRTSGRKQAKELRRLIAASPPDLIFAHRMGAAAALLRAGAKVPTILDMDDIEHVVLERLAGRIADLRRRTRTRLHAWAARFAERRLAARSSAVLVCSEVDALKLRAIAPRAAIEIVPNSATSFGDLPPSPSPTALFVGIAHYGPNREAIVRLADEIWPLVRARVPGARLIIAGEGSDTLQVGNGAGGIELKGFVENLEPLYRDARLVLCPVERGGGTRIKIIEAALNGRPVVSTTIGAEGLVFETGSEIVLADDARTFAECCIELLCAPDRAAAIGRAARARAAAAYDSNAVRERLAALCRRLGDRQGG